MRLIFLGPPGCGKGTQAKLLQDRLGLRVIGTGDILRDAVKRETPLGKKVEPYLTSGQLAPDPLVNEIVAARFRRDDRPTQFIMDGYPRTLVQALTFDAVLKDTGQQLNHVFLFTVPDEDLIKRLSGRKMAEGRSDDNEETVRKRLEVYYANAKEMIQHYRSAGLLREIDAAADIETVYQSIVSICRTKAEPPC